MLKKIHFIACMLATLTVGMRENFSLESCKLDLLGNMES